MTFMSENEHVMTNPNKIDLQSARAVPTAGRMLLNMGAPVRCKAVIALRRRWDMSCVRGLRA